MVVKRLAGLALVTAIVPSQAMAKEIVIHCSGVSRMTIYNPHGNGGTIGGPSSESWTVRTDGHSVSLTTVGEETHTAEGREVQLSSSGLSFCATADGSPCDAVQTKYDKKGFRHSLRLSRVSIAADGTYSSDFSMMSDQAPIKTGMVAEDRGHCDEDDIAQLLQLAGNDGSGDSDSDEPALVVEEAKPEHSSPREKPKTVDVYYACEARDTSGEKPIFYYSSVADIKLPKNFGFPEDIKIRENWRNYITKAMGATDNPTCAPLSIHSMDEALRKQREIVSNRSVYNETVSVNYDPHL